jgi:DNA-binding phage protein
MSNIQKQVSDIVCQLDEREQSFAVEFLTDLKNNQLDKFLSNFEYLVKVQRGINQIAEGRGIVREVITVSGND